VDSDCASAAARVCQKMFDCVPLYGEVAWGDVATCTERVRLSCRFDALAPGSGFTRETVASCVSALDTTSCPDFFARKIDACWPKGGRPDGDRCGSHKQCQSGYCELHGECGYCAPRGGPGAACNDGMPEGCQAGLLCVGVACVLPRQLDEACDTQQPCDLRLYCKDGKCRPTADERQDCAGSSSCDYWKGLFCNPVTGKCQAFTRARDGQPCGVVAGGYAICVPGNNNCKAMNQMGTGTCVERAHDGEQCLTNTCYFPARCDREVCKLPDSARCE
jgi:hypothetical protein